MVRGPAASAPILPGNRKCSTSPREPSPITGKRGWGTQLVHYYGAYSNAHRGIAHKRKAFIEVPPEYKPSDPPRPDSAWLATRSPPRPTYARVSG